MKKIINVKSRVTERLIKGTYGDQREICLLNTLGSRNLYTCRYIYKCRLWVPFCNTILTANNGIRYILDIALIDHFLTFFIYKIEKRKHIFYIKNKNNCFLF